MDGVEPIPLPVDAHWRAEVKRRLKEMGRQQWDLAEHIGCSQGNFSQTLSGTKREQKSSAYARAISLAVGVQLPIVARAILAATYGERADQAAASAFVDAWLRLYGLKP